MIIMFILTLVFYVLGAFANIVFPVLPEAVTTIINSLSIYYLRALPWVFTFIDRGLVTQLIAWWIGYGLLMFSFEVAYHIWRTIMGTADSGRLKLST